MGTLFHRLREQHVQNLWQEVEHGQQGREARQAGGVVGGELREGVRARSESPMAQREDFGFCSVKRSLRQFWQSAVCLQTACSMLVRARPLRPQPWLGQGRCVI